MDGNERLAAYLLHSRRYRDSSLIVDLFTRERGRVACVARGALHAKSKLPVRHPFQLLTIGFRGRGDVATLVAAEALAPPTALSGRRLYCGLYLNELLLKSTARQDPYPSVFDSYAESLGQLQGSSPVEPVLRRFEVHLLDQLGLGLLLDHDTQGQPVNTDSRYTYQIDAGPRQVGADDPQALSGSTLLALKSGQFDDASVMREARDLMRRVLDHHLGGQALRSRELFQ
ncbi:MAG: DNA repair protein RecO [Gammaproteobacteria bacterium]|nr:DNA repair protein RecO [Gammaproteobacteria bacterium]